MKFDGTTIRGIIQLKVRILFLEWKREAVQLSGGCWGDKLKRDLFSGRQRGDVGIILKQNKC